MASNPAPWLLLDLLLQCALQIGSRSPPCAPASAAAPSSAPSWHPTSICLAVPEGQGRKSEPKTRASKLRSQNTPSSDHSPWGAAWISFFLVPPAGWVFHLAARLLVARPIRYPHQAMSCTSRGCTDGTGRRPRCPIHEPTHATRTEWSSVRPRRVYTQPPCCMKPHERKDLPSKSELRPDCDEDAILGSLGQREISILVPLSTREIRGIMDGTPPPIRLCFGQLD